MANAPTLLSIPVELHRAILLALHDPLQLPTTARLTSGLFDVPRPALTDDPGRRGLMALSLTCRAFREIAQGVLFSRVEVDSLEKLSHQPDLSNFWLTLPLLTTLLSSVPDLRILTFEAGRFDALILSHLSTHLQGSNDTPLLPLLTSFGLKENSVRQPPGAPSHDPMVALLLFLKGRGGLKWIQIETAEGVDGGRLEMMVDEWKAANVRLRGLRVSVYGEADQTEEFLDLLTGEEGEEDLLEDVRELVIKLPRWNESSALPVAVGYINKAPTMQARLASRAYYLADESKSEDDGIRTHAISD